MYGMLFVMPTTDDAKGWVSNIRSSVSTVPDLLFQDEHSIRKEKSMKKVSYSDI